MPKKSKKRKVSISEAKRLLLEDESQRLIDMEEVKEEALHKRYTKYHKMIPAESNVKTFVLDLDGNYAKDLTWISDDEQIEKRNK